MIRVAGWLKHCKLSLSLLHGCTHAQRMMRWCDHRLTPAAIVKYSCMQHLDVMSSATAFLSLCKSQPCGCCKQPSRLVATALSYLALLSIHNPTAIEPPIPLTPLTELQSEDLSIELLSGCSFTMVQWLRGTAPLTSTSQVWKTAAGLTIAHWVLPVILQKKMANTLCLMICNSHELCGCHANLGPQFVLGC